GLVVALAGRGWQIRARGVRVAADQGQPAQDGALGTAERLRDVAQVLPRYPPLLQLRVQRGRPRSPGVARLFAPPMAIPPRLPCRGEQFVGQGLGHRRQHARGSLDRPRRDGPTVRPRHVQPDGHLPLGCRSILLRDHFQAIVVVVSAELSPVFFDRRHGPDVKSGSSQKTRLGANDDTYVAIHAAKSGTATPSAPLASRTAGPWSPAGEAAGMDRGQACDGRRPGARLTRPTTTSGDRRAVSINGPVDGAQDARRPTAPTT